MLLLSSTLAVIFLLAPNAVGGGSYFNNRFPWVILLLLLSLFSGFRVPLGRLYMVFIVVAALLSLGTNIFIFKQKSDEIANFLTGTDYGCSEGDLVMLYKNESMELSKVDVIIHAPSYYGIFKGCVNIGNYETALDYFPVRFNKELSMLYAETRNSSSVDFSRYPEINEVIGWELPPEVHNKLKVFYELYFVKDKLTLWRRL